METITFYSYKGGVGRTLALANVAHYLALLGQKVVTIDFDLEAPGLHYKLFPVDPNRSFSPGLVDYVNDQISGDNAERAILDYIIPVNTLPGATGQIWLLPAGGAPNPAYWAKLSSIPWNHLIYGDEATGSVMFLELKEKIREALQPDFLLIDARTGITEIGGVATSLLADKLVCLLTSSRESLDGSRVVLRALSRSLRAPGAGPLRIFPVLSRVPVRHRDTERQIIDRALAFLNEPAADFAATLEFADIPVLHHEASLSEAERLLIGQDDGVAAGPLLQDYLRLFARVTAGLVSRETEPEIERALRGLLDSTEETLETRHAALAIAARRAAQDPDNPERQRGLLVSYTELGDAQMRHGDLSGALDSFRAGMAIADRLAARDPGNAGWQNDLSVSFDRVGDVLVDQGKLPEAEKTYRDSLAIADRLAKSDPGNAGWQRDLSVSFEKVGDVLVAQGKLPEAEKTYRDSLAIRDRLAKSDPGNAGWQRDLSLSYGQVADVLLRRQQNGEARDMAAKALAKARDNLARFPQDRRIAVGIPRFEDLARRAGVP